MKIALIARAFVVLAKINNPMIGFVYPCTMKELELAKGLLYMSSESDEVIKKAQKLIDEALKWERI